MAGQSMSAQQIYDNFANAVGPGGLMQAADYVTSFQAQYESRAADIRALAAAMEEGWTGDAAGAPSRGAGPLAAEHAQAAEAMSMAQAGLTTQSSAWHDVKAKVQPVPPVPQAPPPIPRPPARPSARRPPRGHRPARRRRRPVAALAQQQAGEAAAIARNAAQEAAGYAEQARQAADRARGYANDAARSADAAAK